MSLFIILYGIFLLTAFSFSFKKLIVQNINFNSFIKQNVEQKLNVFLLFALSLLAFAIPFHRVATSIPSIILIIALISFLYVQFKNHFKLKQLQLFKNAYFYLIIAWVLLVIFHSIIFNGSFNKLSLNLMLIFYFIAFIVVKQLHPSLFNTIGKFYVLGAVLVIPLIIMLAKAQFNTLSWNTFYYTNLLDSIKANPITHSFYFNIAIVLAVKYALESNSLKIKMAYYLAIAFFIFTLILFGSKTGYLTSCISFVFIGFNLIKSKFLKFIFILSIPFLLFLLYQQVPYINKKVKGFKWQVSRHDKIILDHRLPRSVIWPGAINLIKAQPIQGYGVGKGFESLKNEYQKIGYQKGSDLRFNAHNQFLESFIQLGILGFLWWILLFVFLIFQIIKHRNKWLLQYFVLLFCYLMVESLFESQMGMVAIAFFLPFFLLQKENYLK